MILRCGAHDNWTRIFADVNGLTTEQHLFFLLNHTKTFCGLSVRIRENPCPDVIGAASENGRKLR